MKLISGKEQPPPDPPFGVGEFQQWDKADVNRLLAGCILEQARVKGEESVR